MRQRVLGLFTWAIHAIAVGARPANSSLPFLGNEELKSVVSQMLGGNVAIAAGRPRPKPKPLSYWSEDNSSYSLVCEEKYRSDMLWEFFDVGGFMASLSDSIPKDYDGTFIEYLIEKAEYVSSFDCKSVTDTDSTSCSFPGFASLDCMSGAVQNPLYFYVLLSIKNFHDWVMRLHVSIGKAGTKVAGVSVSMGKDFVQTEAPPNDTWIATLMAGIFGLFGGGFATLLTVVGRTAAEIGEKATKAIADATAKGKMNAAKLAEFSKGWEKKVADAKKADLKASDTTLGISGGAGMASGGVTISNGIVNGMLLSATDVLQHEIDKIGQLEWAISNGTTILQNIVLAYGNKVLGDKVNNDPDKGIWYSDNKQSLVANLREGTFAFPPEPEFEVDLNKKILRTFYAAALASLWEGTHIVKLRSDLHTVGSRKNPPICQQDWIKRSKWVNKFGSMKTRVYCDGDQGYFVMRREKAKSAGGGDGWGKLYGGDDETLAKYGLDLWTIIKSSEWSQEHIGYAESWNTDWVAKTLLDSKTIDVPLLVNFPVVDIEPFRHNEDIWPSYRAGANCDWECQLGVIVNRVAPHTNITVNGKVIPWPESSIIKSGPRSAWS